ncbi:MAG: LysE family translocator [Ilumatobacteraceae bacterium]|nr:LysE family translocator [Ilumatobacteraceae bacterium]
MPSLDAIARFAVLALALIVVPGPSVMFVIARAVTVGRRAALATVAGNAAGVYAQVVLVALGLGALVERSIAVFTVVKLAGAGYLVWLGVQAIRHRRDPITPGPERAAPRPAWRDGFVVGIANPKAIVFFAAILPQFVERDGAPAGAQMLALGVVFVAIALVSDSVWAVAAGSARSWLLGSGRGLERVRLAGGTVMIGLGLRLALTRRSD